MADEAKQIVVENARLLFMNFKGKEGPYNREGDRNFNLVLDPATAEQMLEDGWNIKYLKARDEGDEPTPMVEVAVSFKNRPPRVIILTKTSRTQLDEGSVEIVDHLDIVNVDLVVRGYEWAVNDKTGVKAYLQSMFITIQEDPLEAKYKIHENPPTMMHEA
jgi:hypothetical protein